MIDGTSYYNNQSTARGISSQSDVKKLASACSPVFDRLILSKIPKDHKATIYEAATGPGILQAWLQDRGYQNLEGSDFSEKEAAMAGEISPSIIHADSITDLEDRFSESSLKVIVALDFYEHIPREQFRRFLEIAFSRLEPGGILIMRGPNGDSPFVGLNLFNDITHVWAYTTTCLKALCSLASFSKIEFDDDSIKGLYSGYSWKVFIMLPTQKLLSLITWAATRQRVKHWGTSLYVYAVK